MPILVIEDHVDNLDLMRYLLGAFGYTALSAEDGVTGIALAESEGPDLILCDIQLPDIDGFEIARRLKRHARLREIPLVAITALAMVGDRERVLAAGFDGYISKPINPETFVGNVEIFLKTAAKS
jgi:CheY-like chemotaxis protein